MVTDFKSVIDLWPSPIELAADIGEDVELVRKWRQRRIPAEYWVPIVEAAEKRGFEGITYERLAQLAAEKSKPDDQRAA